MLLVRRRTAGRIIAALAPRDGVNGAEGVVVDGRVAKADVIVVRADEDVLVRARGIGARKNGDDIARRRLRHMPVVRPARGHGLARAPTVS